MRNSSSLFTAVDEDLEMVFVLIEPIKPETGDQIEPYDMCPHEYL